MSKKTTEGAIDFACYVDGYISIIRQQSNAKYRS